MFGLLADLVGFNQEDRGGDELQGQKAGVRHPAGQSREARRRRVAIGLVMTPSTMPSRRRRFLRLGGSAVTLGLLLLILPFDELMAALGSVPAAVWTGAISVYLCLHLLGVAKWRLLLNGAGAGISFRDAVRCYYMGLFGHIFFPSIVGGDVVRAGLAFRLARSRSAIVFGSLVDRVIDLVALVRSR
jgi:hypothetical protein